MNTVNIKETQLKLYEKLKPSGWGDKLKTFILGEEFTKILTTLLRESSDGKHFTPKLKQVFRAFEECPYKELKIVVVGQDPYPWVIDQITVADGIPFSCSNMKKDQPVLRYIFKEIEDTCYPGGYSWDPDLKRWSNQGILLLNTALTTSVGKSGTHYLLWQPFIAFLFDIITFANPGLIYVFLGTKAKTWSVSVPDNNFKLYTTHPASAVIDNAVNWDSENLFNKVSELSLQHYGQKIIW